MKRVFSQYRNWLLPAVLILFILQAVTFPFALGQSWAESESPDHLLTYTRNRLTWDSETEVDENGVAQLNLFDSEYDNVKSADNSKLVAPGAGKQTTVRLYNRLSRSVTYKVVLYQYQENIPEVIEMWKKLNTKMDLLNADEGKDFAEDDKPVMPEGVEPERVKVIRAVTGRLYGSQYQDFDISWLWNFAKDAENNLQDTLLGSLAVEGENPNTTVGMYIVVEDNNSYTTPESPKTGDSGIGAYLALMAVCGGMLVLLQWEKRKARKCGE